jgi:hypothetical protein
MAVLDMVSEREYMLLQKNGIIARRHTDCANSGFNSLYIIIILDAAQDYGDTVCQYNAAHTRVVIILPIGESVISCHHLHDECLFGRASRNP